MSNSKKVCKNKREIYFESLFRKLRYDIAVSNIKDILNKNSIILDYGCGLDATFYRYLLKKNIKFKKYFGFDPLIRKDISNNNFLLTSDWKKIKSNSFNLITMFAVLEHLPYPKYNFNNFLKLLNKKGHLILTTPTKLSKYILESLFTLMGIVSRREIKEHKHYYSLKEIEKLFNKYSLKVEREKTFELGMNNFVLFKNQKI